MAQFDKGDRVAVTTSTVFQDSGGTPFDPDTVTFKVIADGAAAVSYVYGTDAEATRVTTGSYKLTIDVDQPGLWRVRIEGETSGGVNRGAAEITFSVADTSF